MPSLLSGQGTDELELDPSQTIHRVENQEIFPARPGFTLMLVSGLPPTTTIYQLLAKLR